MPALGLEPQRIAQLRVAYQAMISASIISEFHSSAIKERRQIIMATTMARWKKRVSLRFFGCLLGSCSEPALLCYAL